MRTNDGLLMPLAATMAAMVVPYWRAMRVRCSPSATPWMRGAAAAGAAAAGAAGAGRRAPGTVEPRARRG